MRRPDPCFSVAKIFAAAGFATLALVASFESCGAQQSDCSNGIIRLPYGVNGTLQVCPALAGKAPELDRQLADLKRALSGQQAELRDLDRLVRGLNSVSASLTVSRKAELAQSLSTRLRAADYHVGSAQESAQLADLSDQVESLKDILVQKLSDRATSDRAASALQGAVGDSIAQLKFAKAEQELSGIRAQLNAIGSEVHAVHGQTAAISAKTTEIQRTLQQQQEAAAKQKQQDEENQRRAQAQAAYREYMNPDLFASIDPGGVTNFSRSSSLGGGPYKLAFSITTLRVPDFGSLGVPVVRVALSGGPAAPRVLDLKVDDIEGPLSTWIALVQDVKETKATLCFSMRDPRSKDTREVIQRYTLSVVDDGTTWKPNFIPVGPPAFVPVDPNGTCDGFVRS